MKMAQDFVIDTHKHCFLCLNATGIEYSSPGSNSPLTHSMQHLSKMLKLDRRKVFHKTGNIPEQLVAKVTNSRLMVELCGDCASWNESFSVICQQLEKIKMEVITKLSYLKGKLSVSEVADITEKLLDMDEESGAVLKEKLGIAYMLRKDITQKCGSMLSTSDPRVKIQKLSAEDIPRKMTAADTIKLEVLSEETDFMDCLEDSRMSGNSPTEIDPYSDIVIKHNEEGSSLDLDTEDQLISTNTKFGKYHFQAKKIVDMDPKSPHHRQLKYKCPMCSKQFLKTANYKKHYRSIHIGVRYKCVCRKTFSGSSNLRYHQRHSCGRGPRGREHIPICHCELCGKGFNTKEILSQHLRIIHRKMRDLPCLLCKKMFYLESELKEHQSKLHDE